MAKTRRPDTGVQRHRLTRRAGRTADRVRWIREVLEVHHGERQSAGHPRALEALRAGVDPEALEHILELEERELRRDRAELMRIERSRPRPPPAPAKLEAPMQAAGRERRTAPTRTSSSSAEESGAEPPGGSPPTITAPLGALHCRPGRLSHLGGRRHG